MKKYLLAVAALLLFASCSNGGKKTELATEADSVAYVIGLNVAYNLQRMDSTINVGAVCLAIEEHFADRARMTPEEARRVYLRYVNVSLPEQIQRYEDRFLEDFRERNRTYAKNDAGLTYEVLAVGDESNTARTGRDTVAFRYTAKTVAGDVVDSSYERSDTTRLAVDELMPGLQQSVKLAGEGGRINVWIPARLAYGTEGDDELDIEPNETLFYEIELIEVKRANR